uniref:Putative lipocalin-5 1 n=1 Tax=Amblyomma triste TaxID=251400 RepID=A0A023G2P1_AMBTT
MVLPFTLMVAFATLTASGDEISEQNTEMLAQAVGVMDENIALYSSIDDPSEKCLTCTRTVYEPQNRFVVFVFHYQGQNGEPGTDVPFCVNLTATETLKFGFSPCDEGAITGTSQGYYFDGKSCFLARFPTSNQDHCLLWINEDFIDSVSEECVTQFDQNCGPQRYTLYDKEKCP